jgi:hypothetical protein
MTLVGGLAMTLAIGIAAVMFAAFDVLMWSALPAGLRGGDARLSLAIREWRPK